MKTTKYIFLTLAAMAALSCARMDEQVIPEESGVLPLTLDVRCGGMETRTPGEDEYNENTITHVDYFFFADEAGTQPLGVHGRAQAPESGRFLLEFDVENTAAYSSLKGTSYVYILANYPEEINHSTNYTLETILGWPVNKKLYTAASGSTPASLPDSFVMDSYDPETQKYTVKLSPTKKDDVLDVANNNVKQINLSRLAVKLTVTLNFDQSIQTTDSFGNHETWTPEPEHTMEMYYVNALNNTTVQATPVKRTANTSGSYFSYPSNYPFTPTAKNTVYSYTTDPVYTYPQSWTADDNGEPYFKLHMSWRGTVKDVAQFFYKIPVPTERTLNRNCWYQVTVRVGVLGGTEEDYVVLTDYYYCVADWAEPEWFSGSGLNSAKYFYVPVKEFHIYGDNNISIPYYCNAAVNAYFTNITYMDYNASSSGSTATRSENFTGTGNTSVTDYGGDDNHTYKLESDSENKVVKFTHDMTNLYVQRDITLTIVNSQNTSQSEVVVIHQHPAIELKKAAAGDQYVNGRFARVSNAKDASGNTMGSTWSTDGSTYYHSYPVNYPNRWNPYWTSRSNVYYITNNGTDGYGSLLGNPYWVSSSFFTTDITVTAFSDDNNTYSITGEGNHKYKIGDPRVKASSIYSNFSLNNYLASGNTANGSWTNPGDVMISSQSQNDRNIIAPRFLVSSGLTEIWLTDDGRPTPGSNNSSLFLNFVKRGATFQEAGYPAGRWRLPTEGEVAFIAARQFDGTIPEIFNTDVPYFCSSGRWFIIPSSGTSITFGDNINTNYNGNNIANNIDAKFVYDLWYWGDKPAWDNDPQSGQYVTNQYHPNGHVLTYKNN
ncbi:MAG: hypothetical protein IJK32_09075 [Bacteroidales bacterium]|nr:hypothetical protein [Bacteroidales bacterium]